MTLLHLLPKFRSSFFRVQVFVSVRRNIYISHIAIHPPPAICFFSSTWFVSYLSIAHCIVSYPTNSGMLQNRIWFLVRRKVLKMAALKVPARGDWRLAERP